MAGQTRRSVSMAAERGIRYGILAVLVVGLRQRNAGAVANAICALVGTYLPGVVEDSYAVEFRPWQRVYADSAMLTHAIGMLGPYDETDWWDHLTHTHSATLLGGLVYAVSRRRNRDPGVRVLAAVICVGLLWEALEYVIHTVARRLGLEPLLIMYGKRDTLLDLCFNLVGACLVLLFGERFLQNFVDGD